MRVATVNVNGIRAAWRKGMPMWIEQACPDIILMQEVRAPEEIAQELFSKLNSDWQVVTYPCAIKGRAGVAVAHRGVCEQVRLGVQTEEPDVDTGRWVEAELDIAGQKLTVVSAYLHSGQVGTEKQEQKIAHLERVDDAMRSLLERCGEDRFAVVAGDVNIVASENDIKNWKGNHNKTAGVLDEEIAHVRRWTDSGWIDVVRQQAGAVQGPYSWWSWRGQAFDNDAGWRIDYQFATPALAAKVSAWRIDRADSYDQRWSDHAPVVVDYDLA